jgi:hypothetical protein
MIVSFLVYRRSIYLVKPCIFLLTMHPSMMSDVRRKAHQKVGAEECGNQAL